MFRKEISDYKLIVLIIFVLSFGFIITGCKKKQPESPFQAQLPDTISTLTIGVNEDLSNITVTEEAAVATSQGPESVSSESSSSGLSSPTPEEIQTALKNAGFYKGQIDGKIGPKSQQAILDFQKANDLKQDGKVGPKTWAKLREYLKSQQ